MSYTQNRTPASKGQYNFTRLGEPKLSSQAHVFRLKRINVNLWKILTLLTVLSLLLSQQVLQQTHGFSWPSK